MKKLPALLPEIFFDIRTLVDFYEHGIAQRQDLFQVIWLTSGRGSFTVGQQQGIVTPDQIILIKPGQLTALQCSENIGGYMISFNSVFMAENFQQFFASIQVAASGQEVEDMQSIMVIMLKEFTRNHLIRVDILRRYLKIFLIYLSGLFEQAQHSFQTRNEIMLDKFMALLEKNFRARKMVADYAEALAVTPNYLNEVIKKTTGYSAGYHIRQRVALEAKRQAANTGAGMKSVAYDLGFFDMAHFSKFFKNATGMNFSDYKNSGRLLQQL